MRHVGVVLCLLFIGTPALAGGSSLDKDAVRRVIRAHMAEVRKCYEGRLAERPDLSGKVSLRLTIEPSGAVSKSEVAESTLQDPKTEQCIAKAAEAWQFPKQAQRSVLVYPFELRSAQ